VTNSKSAVYTPPSYIHTRWFWKRSQNSEALQRGVCPGE